MVREGLGAGNGAVAEETLGRATVRGRERPGRVAGLVPGWAERPPSVAPHRIGVLPGEGVGPEVVGAALDVLDAVADSCGLTFDVQPAAPLPRPGPYGPELTDELARFFAATFDAGGAVLCGAVSGRFVYDLRVRFDLFCKLVPLLPHPALVDASIVRPERARGVDVLVVRDNVGGLYTGDFGRADGGRTAYQRVVYTADQVERVVSVAARAAAARRGRLAVITKRGGVPEISRLWWECAAEVAAEHGVTVEQVDVDNACFQIVADPQRFDVVAAPNLLGDIVADVAALLLVSRGMSFSGNFGADGLAVYQTGHGAAFDLAGTGKANPVAQIMTLAFLLRESLGLDAAARAVERAVDDVLASGYRTPDVASSESTVVGTRELAGRVAAAVSTPDRLPTG